MVALREHGPWLDCHFGRITTVPRFVVWQRRCKDPDQVRRLLSLAAIYDGYSRAEAATVGGVGRQIVRDWVEKFNASGPAGL